MSDNPFVFEDRTETVRRKFCPLIKSACLGEKCQWWVMDFMEEHERTRFDCAVSMIAKGITDETLIKSGRK